MNRYEDMVRLYGEVCRQMVAAKILDVSRATIYRMCLDGRLRTACEGTRVDVRSICDYIMKK